MFSFEEFDLLLCLWSQQESAVGLLIFPASPVLLVMAAHDSVWLMQTIAVPDVAMDMIGAQANSIAMVTVRWAENLT